MKYKITPLNTLVVIGITYVIGSYILAKNDPMGFMFLSVIVVIPICLAILIIDWVIQIVAKTYGKIIFTELLLMCLLIVFFQYRERTKTLLISDNPKEQYVTIIYGVENAPQLPVNFFTWEYEVKIPKNGVLLTSTERTDDLPKTNVKTYLGIDLSEKELGFGHFMESEIDCGTKQYKYKSWIIQKHCCMTSSKDRDSLENVLKNVYCK
jgi:hypothetical protein